MWNKDKAIQIAVVESRGLTPTTGCLSRLCITYKRDLFFQMSDSEMYDGKVMSFETLKDLGTFRAHVDLITHKVTILKKIM